MHMRRMRGWLMVLATVGCGSGTTDPDRPVALPERPLDLAARLERDRVIDTAFARATLYTWTTGEQVAELRNTRQLLSRDESPMLRTWTR